MKKTSDKELMMSFVQGDTAAFDLLFERYRNPLFNFIFRMLGDRESAEDLLQDVFIKVFEGRDFYEPRAEFSTWIYTVTRNHTLNLIRSKKYEESRKTVSYEENPERYSSGKNPDRTNGNNSKDEKRQQAETLEKAISELPEEYREIFLLRAVEGLSHDEIGSVLDMNTATVRTKYHRARQMLKSKVTSLLEKV